MDLTSGMNIVPHNGRRIISHDSRDHVYVLMAPDYGVGSKAVSGIIWSYCREIVFSGRNVTIVLFIIIKMPVVCAYKPAEFLPLDALRQQTAEQSCQNTEIILQSSG